MFLGFIPVFTILRGPFRLTDQVDALNEVLKELRAAQSRTRAANDDAVSGQDKAHASERQGPSASNRAAFGVPLPANDVSERENSSVYRPSRVQWLVSNDEENQMAETGGVVVSSTQLPAPAWQQQQQQSSEEPP